MTAFQLVVMVILLALIAWFASKEDQTIDLDRAVKVFLFELVLLFAGLWVHEAGMRDARFEKLFDITHEVATTATDCSVRVDSTLATLRAFEKVWPRIVGP